MTYNTLDEIITIINAFIARQGSTISITRSLKKNSKSPYYKADLAYTKVDITRRRSIDDTRYLIDIKRY